MSRRAWLPVALVVVAGSALGCAPSSPQRAPAPGDQTGEPPLRTNPEIYDDLPVFHTDSEKRK